MIIKCLIVDDEELAREMLNAYASKIADLEVVGLCRSTEEAKEYLSKESIDLIFLDIQMPQQTGVELLEELGDQKPCVVFTTAYADYALKGYELEVVDYLLKPITLHRFQQAVEKATKQIETAQKASKFEEVTVEEEEQFILVHSEHKHHKILLNDIIYIESLKEYVRYHTTQGRIIEYNTMKNLEKSLPEEQFLRIHRSYIVAVNQVQSYENGNLVLKEPHQLPIGKTYKKTILEKLFKS